MNSLSLRHLAVSRQGRWLGVLGLAFVGLTILGVAPTSAAESYRVGVAKVDITPDYPVRLNGFGFRREESTGVSQRIWAKALAISQGDEPPLLILSIDSLGVRLPLVDAVAAELEKRCGVPRQQVALTFSHSHCTPKVNGACDNIFSSPIPPAHQEHLDRYTRELPEKLVAAGVAAIEARSPATLEWYVGQVKFAKNRRAAGGPVDHDLPLLVARAPSGELRALYASYACHCVTLSFNQISGDWSGYAQEWMERKFPGAVALMSIGCGSDSNPLSGVTGDKIDVASQQGAEIADEVARLVASPGRPLAGKLSAELRRIELPLNALPTREQWEQLAQQETPAGYNARTQLARLDRQEPLLRAIDYPVQSFRFGDSLQMVFLAGEVCVDYSLRLKRELRRDRVWLHGYSNDFCAYIPSERLLKEGGYGGGGEIPYFALPATFQPGLEQRIVDEVRRQSPAEFLAATETQGIAPRSPAESQQSLLTHDSLRVELVAAEPLVADPVAIDFGPDGRLWVVEMTDYARGVNDEFAPQGRVRFLTDTNGDGQYDRSTEFLTGLRFPTDVKVWKQGVLVCDAPDIVFASDTDGDGKADVRDVLWTGFATHNPHARVNSLRYGLDNWLYGSGGLFGGKVTNRHRQTVDVTNRDFRWRPDARLLEPVSGQTQQGRPRDDWDNWFGCTNGSLLMHYAVDDHYARRNPHIAPPAASVYVPDYPDSNRLYPRGDLVLFKLSGAPGRPTSACGAEIYRDELLGADFSGNAFTCEPVNQLVHRLRLTRKGATFSGRRAAEEAESEFLTSTDRWFRPVQARTGPDGALWIVDMYRYVIEHPQWIPPEVLAELNVFAGQGRGRIYRIVPKNQPVRPIAKLTELAPERLAAALDSPNGVQRDLVQQLLIWRSESPRESIGDEVVRAVEHVLATSRWPAARVQAAATLEGLRKLRPEQVEPLLASDVAEVRRHAIRLAERWLDTNASLLAAVLARTGDPAPEVRLQLANSLGECRAEGAAEGLAILALAANDDPYLRGAVLSSVRPDNVLAVLETVLARAPNARPEKVKVVDSLLTLAATTGDAVHVARLIEQLVRNRAEAKPPSGESLAWRRSTLARVLDAADRRQLQLGDQLADESRQTLRRFIADARAALSGNLADGERVAAIQLVGRASGVTTKELAVAPEAVDLEQLAVLLSPRASPVVQAAALAGLARAAGTEAPRRLLAAWPDATPRLRGEILDVFLARNDWPAPLLDAVAAGQVLPADWDATRRQRLLTHPNEEIRRRAEQLLAGGNPSSRRELVAAWQSVVTTPGESKRGKEAFGKRCSPCHQMDGAGFQVGPDLAALTNKSAQSLLVAVLDPNRDVDGRYVSYVAALADGRTLSGLLVSETGNSLTLREQGGKDHVLLREDVEELKATGKSVMPEGLEKDLQPQELADLIAYLLPPRVAPKKFPGNQPTLVTPDAQQELALLATVAEIFGDEIAFETDSPFRNIGYWHGAADHVGWQVQVPTAGSFDVYLDYSCANESAGDGFRMEGAEPTLRGQANGTGGWGEYRVLRLGTVTLPAGRSYLTLRQDGPKKKVALLDLRGVHLVPTGKTPVALKGMSVESGQPQTSAEIARILLDDRRPAAERQALIEAHPQRAAEILAAMTVDLPMDAQEEYRRIPWIWRVAIACGKRNQADELRPVLDVAMPLGGKPLRDWQAVVLGGGIVNGISLAGDWPKARIEGVLKVEGILVARWQRALELAATMSDDEQVPTGTRYDALRMIALASWDLRGPQLRKYLAKGTHPELQMGAVSGVSDVAHEQATAALLAGIPDFADRNRELALDGLLRTPERCLALLRAMEQGSPSAEVLGGERRKKLLEHEAAEVREKATSLFGSR